MRQTSVQLKYYHIKNLYKRILIFLFFSLYKRQEETLQFTYVCVLFIIIQVSEISLATIRNDHSIEMLKCGKNLKVFPQKLGEFISEV